MSRPWQIARTSLALGTLAGVAFSWPLWLTRETYPRVPVFEFIPALPEPFDIFFLLIFALGFMVLLWAPQTGVAIAWFVGSAFLILQDQSRLQPWFVEAVLLLAALAFSKTQQAASNSWRVLVAAIYFWSGVHKMNGSFANALFPWLASPIGHLGLGPLPNLGILVPYLEMTMGVSLLFPRTRRIAVVGIIGMHLFLLGLLGPWALGWNSAVWPWNLAMILLVPSLFWYSNVSAKTLFKVTGNRIRIAVLAFVFIVPPLSLAELWDTYPSFDLYSGNSLIGSVVLSPKAWERLNHPQTRAVAEPVGGGYLIRFDDWSIAATNTPAYPAERVLRRLAKSFCAVHENDTDVVFVMEKPARWLYRTGWHKIEQAQMFCP